MGAISDDLLREGFGGSFLNINGEQFWVLSGASAGQFFIAAKLVAPVVDIGSDLGPDVREKVIAHFPKDKFPNLKRNDQLMDSDGQKWKSVGRVDNNAENSVDFELVKIIAKDT